MIKKIKTDQLKPGMFVHDFNCSWLQHPFFTNSKKIDSEDVIEKIISHGISEVYIDTHKGLDVAGAPTQEDVHQEVQTGIDKIAEVEVDRGGNVPLEEELVKAREIQKEAKQVLNSIMDEVRFGREFKTEAAGPVVDKMINSIFRNKDALISLGRIKEVHEYTFMHSISVCALMVSFGNHLGFDVQQLRDFGIGAMFHDIGKMKIPQELLASDHSLSDEEYETMKKHAEYSRLLLEGADGIAEASVTLAAQHHERIDGLGYPLGLKGDEISTYGQAAAIVDVYDAMTSERSYQQRQEPTEVLRKLFEWDSHFNRTLVQHFIRCVGIYPIGSLVRLESGLIGLVLKHGEKSLIHPIIRAVYDTRNKSYITPIDIDLSQQEGENKILSFESQDKWHIEPEKYL